MISERNHSVLSSVKKSAVAGIILLVPILSVLVVVNWLSTRISAFVGPEFIQVTGFEPLNQLIGLTAVLVLVLSILVVTGYFARSYFGKKFENRLDKLFERIPVLGDIYDIAKTTSQELLDGGDNFKEPVKVQTDSIRRTAFRTGNKTEDGKEVLFMPTSPNITSGFVIEVDPKDVEEIDETSEEALQRLLSAGFGGK